MTRIVVLKNMEIILSRYLYGFEGLWGFIASTLLLPVQLFALTDKFFSSIILDKFLLPLP